LKTQQDDFTSPCTFALSHNHKAMLPLSPPERSIKFYADLRFLYTSPPTLPSHPPFHPPKGT